MTSILKVDNIQNSGGTAAMSIDSTGRVFLPQVPSWRVSLTAAQSVTAAGNSIIQWNNTSTENCFVQGGITISSYQVVVPVAGVYQCNFNVRLDGIGSGYVIIQMVRQNTTSGSSETYHIDGDPPTDYVSFAGADVYNLDANDNMKVTVYTSADAAYTIQSNSTFSGHLVG